MALSLGRVGLPLFLSASCVMPAALAAGVSRLPAATCGVLDEAACVAGGGYWLGLDTDCDPNPCPELPGACCRNDGFWLVQVCSDGQRQWLGFGVACDPNPRPQYDFGACGARDGRCEFLTAHQCQQAGGVRWLPDVPCEIDPCDPTPREEESWGRIKRRFR